MCVSALLLPFLVSVFLDTKSKGVRISLFVWGEVDEVPVLIEKFCTEDMTDVPELFGVCEEHGIESMTFESCGNLVVLWCPAIWSADAEFVSVMVLLSIISSSPLCLVSAEALVVEHERESEWLKVLHDKETSDLAFNKRSVSFEANKLWRLPLKIFWNLNSEKSFFLCYNFNRV